MQYNKITLSGYKRFSLNLINELTFTPTQAIQLIIGTNGSGKSSLLSEISPLPANPNDFNPGGFKKIFITNNSYSYELTNTFTTPAKHSFLKEGVELNVGGTVTVQKELARQEFGITKEIQDLLLGKTQFDSMSPSTRRHWFTQLSETNYDYAISLFNRIKERHRDVSGALKLAKKRLVAETAKVMSEAERRVLDKETEDLYALLSIVTDIRKPLETSEDSLELKYSNNFTKAASIAKIIISKKLKVSSSGFASLEDIEFRISDFKNKHEVAKQLSNTNYEEFNSITKLIKDLSLAGEKDSKEIQTTIDELQIDIDNNRKNRNILTQSVENPLDVLRAFDTIRSNVEGTLIELPENKERNYTPDKRQALEDSVRDLKAKHSFLEKEINRLTNLKAHHELHSKSDLTECPKCKHKWVFGFNQNVLDDAIASLAELTNKFLEITVNLSKQEKLLEEVNSYLEKYRSLFRIMESWPILTPLWDHLVTNQVILNDPRKAFNDCSLFLIDLNSEIECSKELKNIEELKFQLSLKAQLGNHDLTKLKQRLVVLEEEMHKHSVSMSILQREIMSLESLVTDIRAIGRLNEEMNNFSNLSQQATTELIEHNRRDTVLKIIRHVQSLVSRKEDIVANVRLQVGIIEDLSNQIKILETDEEALLLLVNGLSPTDGLIAEGLLGFIRLFCGKMNSFIKKIWAYELKIIPCQLETDGSVDLDYKFPFIVSGNAKPIEDVSLASTGMQEVINMAFCISAMKYLGLDQSALYMDEFCAAMDQDHRFNAIQAVKSLVENEHFKQIFIISHNLEFHGAFPNAQLCVLNADNIVVPKDMEYNKHVIMK